MARRAIRGRASWSRRRPSTISSEDLPVPDDQDAIGVGRGARIVRDQHDRLLEPIGGVPQQVEDLGAGRVVEVAGRLIGQDDGRRRRQCPRQRHALLLAGRELVGPVVGLVAEPDHRQQLADPLPVACRRVAGDEERQRHVLGDAQQRDEVEELEDESGLVAPGERPVLLVERRDADAVDDDLARRWQVETAEQVQHRGLAGAGAAHDRDELAPLDLERHAAERIDLALAQRIALDEVSAPRG